MIVSLLLLSPLVAAQFIDPYFIRPYTILDNDPVVRTPIQPTWFTENSPEIFSHGDVLHIEKRRPTDRESPYNAILRTPAFLPIEGASTYWDISVDVMPQTLFFGIAKIDSPLPTVPTGYGMKFLGYGGPGNLADGSSGLISRWGPPLGPNTSKIGVLATVSEGRLNVYFYVDGGALGLGYSLPANLFPSGVRFAIQSSGPAQFAYIPDTPTPAERERPKYIPKGIEGEWTIEPGQWLSEGLADAISRQPTLELNIRNEDSYTVNMRVVNVARVLITKQGDGTWKTGSIMTTRMAGPENLMILERRLLQFVEKAVRWSLSPNGSTLTVSTPTQSLSLTRNGSHERPPEVLNVSWLLDQ